MCILLTTFLNRSLREGIVLCFSMPHLQAHFSLISNICSYFSSHFFSEFHGAVTYAFDGIFSWQMYGSTEATEEGKAYTVSSYTVCFLFNFSVFYFVTYFYFQFDISNFYSLYNIYYFTF